MRYDSCRQCTKRRIKCDKATPQCLKCVKKGIECSGVGKIYKFATNLTPDVVGTSFHAKDRVEGLQQDEIDVPCDATSTTATTSLVSPDTESISGDITGNFDDDEIEVAQSTEVELYTDHIGLGQQPHQQSLSTLVHGNNGNRLGQSLELHKPEQIILLNHFANVIAPYMTVTYDARSNGYRDLILPLAHQDALVQRSVMVVSALHLGNQQTTLRHHAEVGRAAILARLRQDVAKGRLEDVLNVSTWATLLILLVGETVTGTSDFVQLFSMLCSLMTLQERSISGSQDMSTFLDYQRRMFLFMTPPLIGATEPLEPWSASEEIFFEFFGLSPTMESSRCHNISIIRDAFKLMHTLTMRQNKSLLPEAVVNLTLEQLCTLVTPVTKSTTGAHTLVWVYFIAAAESRTSAHRAFFSHRLGELYDIAKFGNIPVALATLEKIWALDTSRRWTRETNLIIPVLVI